MHLQGQPDAACGGESGSVQEKGGDMTIEKRDLKRRRRYRDELLDRLYETAKVERRRLADQISTEFRETVDALEDLEAVEEEENRKAVS